MDIAVLVIIIAVILLGIAGTFLPILPGIPLIFAAIAAYGWYEGFQHITSRFLVIMAGLAILSLFVDYVSTYLGAKYFNSSKMGLYGAVVGSIIGLFVLPPLGLLICPWLGAVAGELLQGNELDKAWRSGLGAVIGLFSGILFKVVVGIAMLVAFIIVIL
jgi:uncharacterized protein